MTETNPNQPNNESKELNPDDVRTMSAPVVNRVHSRFASAQEEASLDKASLVRLAIRLFIKQYYRGKGKWVFPRELDLDMIVSKDSARCDYELPE